MDITVSQSGYSTMYYKMQQKARKGCTMSLLQRIKKIKDDKFEFPNLI
jgi:hypothetical protein